MTRTTDEKAAFAAGAIALPGAVAVIAPFVLIQAFVLCKLWNWYVVPFFGAHKLTMVFAYGIALIVSFLTKPVATAEKSDRPLFDLTRALLRPFGTLFFGWLGTLFF